MDLHYIASGAITGALAVGATSACEGPKHDNTSVNSDRTFLNRNWARPHMAAPTASYGPSYAYQQNLPSKESLTSTIG
jgi:hypothetical protein